LGVKKKLPVGAGGNNRKTEKKTNSPKARWWKRLRKFSNKQNLPGKGEKTMHLSVGYIDRRMRADAMIR